MLIRSRKIADRASRGRPKRFQRAWRRLRNLCCGSGRRPSSADRPGAHPPCCVTEGGSMATEPKRKDPTEAALSAIEEALSLDATPGRQARREEEGEPRLPDVAESRPLSEAPRRPLEGEGIVLPAAEPATPPPPRGAEIVSPDRAAVANDDRESVGSILQALQRRPSRRPYVLATLASLLWLGAVAGFVTTQIEGGFHAFIT